MSQLISTTGVRFFRNILKHSFNVCVIFLDLDAQIAIQWSEALDEIFRQNYKSDPALSWQYFGSSTGIMRHYPGN